MQTIRKLTKVDYQDIFALSQFAFQYELSEAELVKKQSEAKRHDIWGVMVNEQLAAKMHLIPLTCYINGNEFAMGGVSSVATWPEYRRQGMVKQLLHHGLRQMKQEGQLLSFLHPFSVPFYRNYGWEVVFTDKKYTITTDQLKGNWRDARGLVRRVEDNIPLLDRIYQTYAKKFTGMLVRDEKWWEQRVLKNRPYIAVAYNEETEPEGYVMYKVKDDTLTVHDMAYTSVNGQKLLLQFIQNHDSMVKQVKMTVQEHDNLPLLMDEPRFEQQIAPYFMARIVDVFAFLQQYPFSGGSFVAINIKDDFFPENNGVYHIKQGEVNKMPAGSAAGSAVACTIQSLTAMLLGYTRPVELYELELISGGQDQVKKLESLIPKQQPYFADFF